jgi:hypothetical protein
MLAVLLATSVSAARAAPAAEPDAVALAQAEHAFSEGEKSRGDSVAARKWFRSSASAYDELWRRGLHNPALARNRARAHRLAGDLPRAITALHEGLAAARYDRLLQVELDDARSAVAYPHDGDLAALCRPRPVATIGTRMSPAEAYLAAGTLWLLTCLGVVRFAMARAWLWLGFAGVWLAGLLLLGGLWFQDWRQQTRLAEKPLVIVKDDATLRKGNGDTWELRLQQRLPRGVEVRELTRRGGWVQVELAGGPVGWLPEAVVLVPTR